MLCRKAKSFGRAKEINTCTSPYPYLYTYLIELQVHIHGGPRIDYESTHSLYEALISMKIVLRVEDLNLDRRDDGGRPHGRSCSG